MRQHQRPPRHPPRCRSLRRGLLAAAEPGRVRGDGTGRGLRGGHAALPRLLRERAHTLTPFISPILFLSPSHPHLQPQPHLSPISIPQPIPVPIPSSFLSYFCSHPHPNPSPSYSHPHSFPCPHPIPILIPSLLHSQLHPLPNHIPVPIPIPNLIPFPSPYPLPSPPHPQIPFPFHPHPCPHPTVPVRMSWLMPSTEMMALAMPCSVSLSRTTPLIPRCTWGPWAGAGVSGVGTCAGGTHTQAYTRVCVCARHTWHRVRPDPGVGHGAMAHVAGSTHPLHWRATDGTRMPGA